MNIEGKTALITGGATRLGRAIALALAAEGMNLLLHYHRSARPARQTQKEAESFGVRVSLLKADLGKFSGIQSLLRQAFRHSRKIELLINNAAIFYKTPLGQVKEKDWDAFQNVNLKAPFFLSEAIGLRMVKQKEGKIINLADWSVYRPYTQYLPYCASKAGLVALTQGLARALAPHVPVNAIAPGPILPAVPSPMRRDCQAATKLEVSSPAAGRSPAENRQIIQRTPLKRFGSPEDIVETVRYLLKGTDFVTGIILPVDGGNLIA